MFLDTLELLDEMTRTTGTNREPRLYSVNS